MVVGAAASAGRGGERERRIQFPILAQFHDSSPRVREDRGLGWQPVGIPWGRRGDRKCLNFPLPQSFPLCSYEGEIG